MMILTWDNGYYSLTIEIYTKYVYIYIFNLKKKEKEKNPYEEKRKKTPIIINNKNKKGINLPHHGNDENMEVISQILHFHSPLNI